LKSSSQLFPVELISAEVRIDHFEDSYSLKPNKSKDNSVEIALIHLHASRNPDGDQVLFVHDVFESHWQWTDGPCKPVIAKLLAQGVSVWLMDWRAHGSSKKNKQPQLNHIEEMAALDLSSVTAFIEEKNGQPLTLVARGLGSQMVLLGLAGLRNIKRYILIDAGSVRGLRRYWIPGLKWLKQSKLIGRHWISGSGSEQEPVSLFKNQLSRQGLFARFRHKNTRQQLQALQQLAGNIIWLCAQGSAETVARRHAGKQARIHRVKPSEVHDEIYKLVSSQSI
jgi:pimeloyl-ACP methyl ester carboxylesterase